MDEVRPTAEYESLRVGGVRLRELPSSSKRTVYNPDMRVVASCEATGERVVGTFMSVVNTIGIWLPTTGKWTIEVAHDFVADDRSPLHCRRCGMQAKAHS